MSSTALSPDERDALLSELTQRTTTPGFHFLSADHIGRLNEARSEGAPIVSLFLELTPEQRVGDTWETTFKELRARALERPGARGHERAVRAELDRIEEALRRGLPRTGRGVAFFACEAIGLFEQIGVAIGLPNEVQVHSQPYVRPLARVRDEHDRFVIALVSAHKSRFFFAQIGLVEEVYTLEGQELELTDFASKDQRQSMRDDLKKKHAMRSAHALELIASTLGARHVIYSAAPDLEPLFLDALDQATRQKVAASFGCEINATTAEVAQTAEVVQREVEAREEMETISRVRELLSTRAVAGLDATLEMLNQHRVMTLIVDDAVHMPGGVERETGLLTAQTGGTHTETGGTIEPEPDLVEVMLDRAMAQGASLELVRSEAAREALHAHGPAAALLRF
ncbi:MAG: peptide chain release factor 1 [Rubricoccaceae bacterium]